MSDDDLMGPINIHEFEAVAKRKMNKLAYDFIAGGVEDELTLQANRAAYTRVFLVPRVMVDVSKVDTSTEILGMKLDAPIIIAPTGGKNLVMPDAESVVARAAREEQHPDLHGDRRREADRGRAAGEVVDEHHRAGDESGGVELRAARRGPGRKSHRGHRGQPISVQPRPQQPQSFRLRLHGQTASRSRTRWSSRGIRRRPRCGSRTRRR